MQPEYHVSRTLPDSYLARSSTEDSSMPLETKQVRTKLTVQERLIADCRRLKEILSLHRKQAQELFITKASALEAVPIAAEAIAMISRLAQQKEQIWKLFSSRSSISFDIIAKAICFIPQFVQTHTITKQQRLDCVHLLTFGRLTLTKQQVMDLTCANLDLLLILFRARNFIWTPDYSLLDFAKHLADYPFIMQNDNAPFTDLKQWFEVQEPDSILANCLDDAEYLTGELAVKDESGNYCEDQIWESFAPNSVNRAKAMRLSFLSFNLVRRLQEPGDKISYNQAKLFELTKPANLWEQVSQVGNADDLRALLICIQDRLTVDKKYYEDVLSGESDHVLQRVLDQIFSIKVSTDPDLSYQCSLGPIKTELIKMKSFQSDFLCIGQLLTIYLRQQNIAILKSHVKEYLTLQPVELDGKLVLQQSHKLLQNLMLNLNTLLGFEANPAEHFGWLVRLLEAWIQYQSVDVYHLLDSKLTLITSSEKLWILATFIIGVFTFSQAAEFSSRIFESSLLTSLETILNPETLKILLHPLLIMLTTIMQSDASLIRQLLEPQLNGFIIKLMANLNDWKPAQQWSVHKDKVSQQVQALLSFFECLSITQMGQNCLQELIWNRVTYETVNQDFDEKDFCLFRETKLDTLAKSNTRLVFVINECFTDKINLAQSILDILMVSFDKSYALYKNYELAAYDMRKNHKTDIDNLRKLLRIAQMDKTGRQRNEIQFDTWKCLLSHSCSLYELNGAHTNKDATHLLEQRQDLFALIESLSILGFSKQADQLMQLVFTVIVSEADREGSKGLLVATSVIVNKLQTLLQKPITWQTHKIFNCYANLHFLQRSKVGQLHDFSDTIKLLMQQVCEKTSQCKLRISDYCKNQEDSELYKKLQLCQDPYEYKQQPELFNILSEQAEQEQYLDFLDMLFATSNPDSTAILNSKSCKEVVYQNQYTFGVALAQIARSFVQGVSVYNEFGLSIIHKYTQKRHFSDLKISVILNDGIAQLCNLWKVLVENNSAESEIDQQSIEQQRKYLWAILLNFILMQKDAYKTLATENHSRPQKSPQDVMICLYQQLIGILEGLEVITKPTVKTLRLVVFRLLQSIIVHPWGAKEEERKEYAPSQDEITQLTTMGFEQHFAETALLMARETGRVALEILLSDQAALLQFMMLQQTKKESAESDELNKALLLSLQLQKKDFYDQIQNLQSGLTEKLLQVNQSTMVSPYMALQLINLNKQARFVDVPSLLQTQPSAILFQIGLIALNEGQEWQNVDAVVQIGSKLQQRNDQEALFFYNLFMLKLTQQREIPQLNQQLKSMLLDTLVLAKTKDVILVTLYLNLQQKSRTDQAVEALDLIQNYLTWQTKSEVLPALFVMALYSQKSHVEMLATQISGAFSTLKQFKLAQIAKWGKQAEVKVEYRLEDVCEFVLEMEAGIDDAKQAIHKTCLIKDQICSQKEYQTQEVEIQPNERKTVESLLRYFEQESNEIVDDQLPFKYYLLGLLTKIIRILPHLRPLLNNFSNMFVNAVCQLTQTSKLHCMIVDVLAPLSGCTITKEIIDCAVSVLEQHPFAALSILCCLVTDVNIYENNRTICTQNHYLDNISSLIQSQFLEKIKTIDFAEKEQALLIQILKELSHTDLVEVVAQQDAVERIARILEDDYDDEFEPIYRSDIINPRQARESRPQIGLQAHLNAFLQHLERRQSSQFERISEAWTTEESQASKIIQSLMLDRNQQHESDSCLRQLDQKPSRSLQEAMNNRELFEFQKLTQQFMCLKPLSKLRVQTELESNVQTYFSLEETFQDTGKLPYSLITVEQSAIREGDFSQSKVDILLNSVLEGATEQNTVAVELVSQVTEPVQEVIQEEVKQDAVVSEQEVVEEQKQERSAFEEIEEEEKHAEVEVAQEQVVQNDANPVQIEDMTFGFPNSVLLQFGIEPEILHDLPEDLRQELLSTVNWQQPQVQQPGQEGLDQDFLNSLPADIRAEIVEQHRRNQEQPHAQPAELDVASFIQTIVDPQMRVETLLGLPPEVIETLPPDLRAEYARAQSQYNDRARAQMESEQRRQSRRVADGVPPSSLKSRLIQIASQTSIDDLNELKMTPDEAAFVNCGSNERKKEQFTLDTDWCLKCLYAAHPTDNYRFDLLGLLLRQPQLQIIDKLLEQLQKQQNTVQVLVIIGVIRLLLKQRYYPLFPQFIERETSLIAFTLGQLCVSQGAMLRNYQLLFCDIMKQEQNNVYFVPEPQMKLLISIAATDADKALSMVVNFLQKSGDKNKASLQSICGSQILSEYQLVIASISKIDFATPPTKAILDSLPLHSSALLVKLQGLVRWCGTECKIDSQSLLDKLGPLMIYAAQVSRLPTMFAMELNLLICTAFQDFVVELKTIQNVSSETEIRVLVEKPKVQALFKQDVEVSPGLQQLCKFCMIHKDLIEKVLDQDEGQLAKYLKYMPSVLTFQRKQKEFKDQIMAYNPERVWPLGLKISRKNIFMDAFAQLAYKSVAELKMPLKIEFIGEVGIDAGGLRRDFYIELSKAMFDPNYSLFTRTSNGVTFHPNQKSHVNPEHLNFFRFIGQFIGKSLYDGELLELHLSKPIYKMMVGEDLLFEDLEDLDNLFHQSVQWSMKEDVSELGFTFSVTRDYFGKMERMDLIENGNQVQVTNENKMQYLEKLCRYQLYDSVKEQIDAFLKGFYELIPKSIVQMFSASELDLLISGLPKVDLQDLKRNTNYLVYNEESPQIKWLWQALNEFTDEQMGKFLQFVTGCSRVPLAGFAELQGMHGPEKFRVAKAGGSDRLPQGHTCYNQLDLPEYESFAILQERLIFAISECGGFGFA